MDRKLINRYVSAIVVQIVKTEHGYLAQKHILYW